MKKYELKHTRMDNKTEIEVLKKEMQMVTEQNTKEHDELKELIKNANTVTANAYADMSKKLDQALCSKADKEEFLWWRNLLVAGIMLTIALGVLGLYLR